MEDWKTTAIVAAGVIALGIMLYGAWHAWVRYPRRFDNARPTDLAAVKAQRATPYN